MSRKTTTTEAGGAFRGASGYVKQTTEQPFFPYGCPYCKRENVTSKPGNSCGRQECNEKWKKDHQGVGDAIARRFK
jgi:hypothetical protein